MTGYTKLFGSIVDSTIWRESKADAKGHHLEALTIREHLKALREMHSGETAKALCETNVGE
jgi:hypothetical protein